MENYGIKSNQIRPNLGVICALESATRKISSAFLHFLSLSACLSRYVFMWLFFAVRSFLKYGKYNALAFRVIRLCIRFDRYTRFVPATTTAYLHTLIYFMQIRSDVKWYSPFTLSIDAH